MSVWAEFAECIYNLSPDFHMHVRTRKIRESAVQAYLIAKIRAAGGFAVKIESPSRRGIPDVLIIWRRFTLFVEVKMSTRSKPSAIQSLTIREMREAGGHVTVVSGKAEADDYLLWLQRL